VGRKRKKPRQTKILGGGVLGKTLFFPERRYDGKPELFKDKESFHR